MYFWENNPERARQWAYQKRKAGTLKEPAVIGAAIEFTMQFLAKNGERPFDSVRAVFVEGKPIYPDAGFNEKTHIQVSIINPNCIKGFFLERKMEGSHPAV